MADLSTLVSKFLAGELYDGDTVCYDHIYNTDSPNKEQKTRLVRAAKNDMKFLEAEGYVVTLVVSDNPYLEIEVKKQ